MPQLEQIGTFLSQAFWLVIAFGVLFFILRTIALPKIQATLEARREKIEGDLDRAQTLRQEAEQVLAEYEAAMAEGREKARSVVREVTEESKTTAAAQHETLAKKLAEEIQGAEARIETAKKDAVSHIRDVAADVVQTATQRLIDSKVDKRSASAAVNAVAEN